MSKVIRASMLPASNDCMRRAMANQYAKELAKYGYKLRHTLNNIGATIGTATHSVIEKYFASKIYQTEYNEKNSLDEVINTLQDNIKNGILWDDTTSNIDTAIYQIKRMATAYIESVGKHIIPIETEIRLEVDYNDWIISGQIDLVAQHEQGGIHLHDLKTGTTYRSHHAQLGAYSLLYRSVNTDAYVKSATIDYVERLPKSRAQKEPIITNYDVALCERVAEATIDRIIENFNKFEATGNINSFPENPMSMLCNEKYCPAFNTDFCPITKK